LAKRSIMHGRASQLNLPIPQLIEAARFKLAEAILSVATDDSRDIEALKRAGLDALRRSASSDGQ
jgi:hypothetical protein